MGGEVSKFSIYKIGTEKCDPTLHGDFRKGPNLIRLEGNFCISTHSENCLHQLINHYSQNVTGNGLASAKILWV